MFLEGVAPYALTPNEKERFLKAQLEELLVHHEQKCAPYARVVKDCTDAFVALGGNGLCIMQQNGLTGDLTFTWKTNFSSVGVEWHPTLNRVISPLNSCSRLAAHGDMRPDR